MDDDRPAPAYSNQTFAAAVAAHRQGRSAEAERLYRAVLAAEPDHFGARFCLGLICLGRNADEAVGLFRAAFAGANSADAHNRLGILLAAIGCFDQAVSHYQQALSLARDFAEAHVNLGAALEALRRTDEAMAHYRLALALKPDCAEAHNNLGNALLARQRVEEAISHYHLALAHKRGFAEAHSNLGRALQALGRLDDAIGHYEQAIALKQGYADAYNNLGTALQALGRFDQAHAAFETAIDLAPRKTALRLNMGNSYRFSEGDPHLAAMERLAEDMAGLDEDGRIALHFALGKAYQDIGRHERCFDHLLEGNALKRRHVVYDEAATVAAITRTRAAFTCELMRDRKGAGNPSPVPVFIVGMPRSGSTLVEQILASHPKVSGGGERPDFERAVASLSDDGASLGSPDALANLSGQQLRRLAARYLAGMAAGTAAERTTDKALGNFRFVGLINLALPNARIIHTRRDPVDTCLSCFSKLFTDDQPYSYDLGELGRYYRAYDDLMEHWRRVLPDGVMIEVRYEELVADLAPQARRIVAHCGLAWDDACLSFHRTQRPIQTASVWQVRQPIYRSSVRSWPLQPETLAPLLEALDVERGESLRLAVRGFNPTDLAVA
jgi:tetratricopeptide (TPR) repeat protein